MADIEIKSFDSPDETRPFEGNGQADVVNVAGKTIGKGTFEPGWRWSENIKPIAQTDSWNASSSSMRNTVSVILSCTVSHMASNSFMPSRL